MTISLYNRKGGVGKTSTTHHLAGTLAKMGRRVLVVDKDPQGSLTQGFLGPVAFRDLEPRETILDVYAGNFPYPANVIRPTGVPGLDLLPGCKGLDPFNTPTPEFAPSDLQQCLRVFLGQVGADYDFVLIDCAPNLYTCSFVALVASDYVLVPLQAEDYGAQGLEPVNAAIAEVQAGPNPGLALLGYLVTMYDKRLGIHQSYDATLREIYPGLVFDAQFPAAKDFKEAVAARQMISEYKPKGAAAKAVRAIADELEARVDSGRNLAPLAEVA